MFFMSPFHTLVLLPGTLVSFGHTTGSHDGASGSSNTLVLVAVLHNDKCCRMFCMLQFHRLVLLLDTRVYFRHTAVSHDGAAGSLNALVLTAVSHDGAAGPVLQDVLYVAVPQVGAASGYTGILWRHCGFTQWCCKTFCVMPFHRSV